MCANYSKNLRAEMADDTVAGHQYNSRSGAKSSDPHLSTLSMVTSVEIKNFRGFKDFAIEGLAPINVIVGDNASGKTAFLEAIYLAVSGNAQQPFVIKQWRGQDVRFQTGSMHSVVHA